MSSGDYFAELSSVSIGLSGVVNYSSSAFCGDSNFTYVLQELSGLISFRSRPLLGLLRAECSSTIDVDVMSVFEPRCSSITPRLDEHPALSPYKGMLSLFVFERIARLEIEGRSPKFVFVAPLVMIQRFEASGVWCLSEKGVLFPVLSFNFCVKSRFVSYSFLHVVVIFFLSGFVSAVECYYYSLHVRDF